MDAIKWIRDTIYRVREMYTDEQWKRVGKGLGVCILLIICCITVPVSISRGHEYTQARDSLGERIYTCLLLIADSSCNDNGETTREALNGMSEWFAVATELNSYLTERFGTRYTVLTSDRIANISSAITGLEKAYDTGLNMQEAQNNMNACMNGLRTLLEERYTDDMRLKKR